MDSTSEKTVKEVLLPEKKIDEKQVEEQVKKGPLTKKTNDVIISKKKPTAETSNNVEEKEVIDIEDKQPESLYAPDLGGSSTLQNNSN
jgi:hypothetical protein